MKELNPFRIINNLFNRQHKNLPDKVLNGDLNKIRDFGAFYALHKDSIEMIEFARKKNLLNISLEDFLRACEYECNKLDKKSNDVFQEC